MRGEGRGVRERHHSGRAADSGIAQPIIERAEWRRVLDSAADSVEGRCDQFECHEGGVAGERGVQRLGKLGGETKTAIKIGMTQHDDDPGPVISAAIEPATD